MVDAARFEELLNGLAGVTAAVVGDYAADAYWAADMTRAELSRETPYYNKPVISERYSLGAAGNVAANLLALGCTVQPVTLLGTDWRGDVIIRLLEEQGADTSGIIRSPERLSTGFIKTIVRGFEVENEDARMDFENTARPGAGDEAELLSAVKAAAGSADIVLVCDQVGNGIVSDSLLLSLVDLAGEKDAPLFIADSRYRIGEFRNMFLKPNEIEAAAAAGVERDTDGFITAAGAALAEHGRQVFVTAGPDGVYGFGGAEFHQPGFPVSGEIDIVGAGDACLAGLSASLAAGADPAEAAFMGCLCSSVTVRKLQTTGTASPEELRQQFEEVV